MDFAETVAILVAGELSGGMTVRAMAIALLGQSSIDIVFVGVDNSSRCDRSLDQRGDRDLLDVLQHPNHRHSGSLNHAEDGGLFLGQRLTASLPLHLPTSRGPAFFFRLGMALMSRHYIDFVADGLDGLSWTVPSRSWEAII